MSLAKRKDILKNKAINNFYNGPTLYKIINSGFINHIVKEINDKKTIPNVKSLVDHDLNGNEQFLMIFNEFIHFIKKSFPTLNNLEINIRNILEDKVPEVLLCKYYWGDNNNIPYFNYRFKKLIVENFYNNAIYISKKDSLAELNNIIKGLDLNSEDDVNYLFNFLIKIVWCNYDNQSNLTFLFRNYKSYIKDLNSGNNEESVYEHYCIQYKLLLDSYIKRENALEIILN